MSRAAGAWRRAARRCAAFADRYVSWMEGAPLERAAWVEDGLPLALVVPIVIALPFALSGPIRAVSGCSMVVALAIAIVASAVVAAPLVMIARARRGRRQPIVAYVLPAMLALGSCLLLYRRAFAGLTNYAGGDGGVHASIVDAFAHVSPRIYQGFVSMHAMAYWVEQLAHTNVFWGLCTTYYFGVAVVAAVPCMLSFVALATYRESRAAYAIGVVVCAVTSIAIAYWVVLPQQHYHQTDGFFPHLFGLIPLELLWLVDAGVRARGLRWAGLAFATLFYRYTYGLNFGDLAISVAIVCFADSFGGGVPAVPRWSARLLPFAASVAARSVYAALMPLLASFGWFIPYDVPAVVVAQCIGMAALVVLVLVSGRGVDDRATRLFRLPLVFGAVNALVTHHVVVMRPPQPYYLLKYPIHGVVLLASAAVVAATLSSALAVRAVAERRHRWRLAPVAVTLLLLGSAVSRWRLGYAPFQPTFQERVWGHAPFTTARPLADLHAWADIDSVLAREHKQFGGYITSYWPMFNFMNAGLGYYNGGSSFWAHGGVLDSPGYCVFWDRGNVDWWSKPNDLTTPLRASMVALEARDDKACVTYRAAWNRSVGRTLCHVCEAERP